ncbi:uncharacterized protein ATC70_011936 [Mucor velutinosus]|uniref:Uncharacterized protein n=1 Tax=Mucor velutinosus TaxID=708070 RepID=A0AAN7DT44_9FUNG|nr:hypothetical protein ATC70_011936 [Mucor velutinosus]
MLKEKSAIDLLHVAKHDASSVAFLHFSNHVMASVFYNTHDSTGLNIGGLVCTVKATNKNGITTTYSQVDMVRFLPTSRPRTIIQPPESASLPPEPRNPQPTTTTKWKRVFEEGLKLLENEHATKKARLNELDSRIKELMEKRQSILLGIEDFEKKKRLAKEIIS